MILKKIHGKTIDEARDEARRQYGEHVVVLETFAGNGKNEPASVTVMVDQPKRELTVTDTTPPGNFRNVFYKRSDVARMRRVKSPAEQMREAAEDGNQRQLNTLQADSVSAGSSGTAGSAGSSATADSVRFMPEQPMPTRFEPRSAGTSRLESLRRYASETETTRGKNLLENQPQSQRFQFTRDEPASKPGPSRFGSNTGAPDSVASHESKREVEVSAANPVTATKKTTPNSNLPQASDTRKKTAATNDLPQEPVAAGKKAAPTTDLPLAEPKGTGSALENIRNSVARGQEDQSRREIAALHKRFDRLEALLDNNLAAADIDLVAHPAFQQLIKSGIRPALVSRWFTRIIKKGIDPAEHPERFMAELSGIVRDALEKQPDKAASPIQVFVGTSGAGKTNLVMHLALYARKHGKNVAVVAVQPPTEAPYYTVLEPFCASEDLAFIRCTSEQGILDLQDNMQDFDMVLVDTPSLPMSKDKAWRMAWSLRQKWSVPGVKASADGPVTEDIPPLPAELNYVANAANGASALSYLLSLHHTLEPDVVSFTHLDEIAQWGAIIPFMDEMNAPCRYLGAGTTEETGIRPYDAAEVAQNILQDS